MELTTLLILAAGTTAVAVPVFGRIAAMTGQQPGNRSHWIQKGDFLCLDDEVVRVERLEASKVLVRSHDNRLYHVRTWKLICQNISVFIPW